VGAEHCLSSDLLLQRELPLRVLARCKERQQPATLPDRLFEGSPPSTKCDGFFGPHFSHDIACHDSFLSAWAVLVTFYVPWPGCLRPRHRQGLALFAIPADHPTLPQARNAHHLLGNIEGLGANIAQTRKRSYQTSGLRRLPNCRHLLLETPTG